MLPNNRHSKLAWFTSTRTSPHPPPPPPPPPSLSTPPPLPRMVATANGLDSRLIQAAQALLAAGRGSPDGRSAMSLPDFVAARCKQLLAGYPTTLEEDEALLQQLEQQQRQRQQQQQQHGGAGRTEAALAAPAAAEAAAAAAAAGVRPGQLATAVRYRAGKKRVLHATLAAVRQSRGQL